MSAPEKRPLGGGSTLFPLAGSGSFDGYFERVTAPPRAAGGHFSASSLFVLNFACRPRAEIAPDVAMRVRSMVSIGAARSIVGRALAVK